MWTYLTQPFTFTLPGFDTTELDPWQEEAVEWRRLHVVWPSYLATRSTENASSPEPVAATRTIGRDTADYAYCAMAPD
jgi:hypothetical protein